MQIRTVCYGSQLVGGVLTRNTKADVSSQQLGKSLLLFSAQLSHCRTVLRLFDDLSMLAYSHSYGLGASVIHATLQSYVVQIARNSVPLSVDFGIKGLESVSVANMSIADVQPTSR